jgi:hypothetical protein
MSSTGVASPCELYPTRTPLVLCELLYELSLVKKDFSGNHVP